MKELKVESAKCKVIEVVAKRLHNFAFYTLSFAFALTGAAAEMELEWSYRDGHTEREFRALQESGGTAAFSLARSEIIARGAASVAKIKAGRDIYARLSHLQFEFMESHEAVAAGVYRTTLSNGESVVVNYGERPATVDGVAVPALGWILVPRSIADTAGI